MKLLVCPLVLILVRREERSPDPTQHICPGLGGCSRIAVTLHLYNTCHRARARKFSYSPSSVIWLAIVSDIYKTNIVCSQLLGIKCLSF